MVQILSILQSLVHGSSSQLASPSDYNTCRTLWWRDSKAITSTYSTHNKTEKKINNLNNQNLALKSVHLASLYLLATLSSVTICGGSLFHTSITRIANNCAQIFTLESGQYSLRECPLVQPPDNVKNSLQNFKTGNQVIFNYTVRKEGATWHHLGCQFLVQ